MSCVHLTDTWSEFVSAKPLTRSRPGGRVASVSWLEDARARFPRRCRWCKTAIGTDHSVVDPDRRCAACRPLPLQDRPGRRRG